MKKVLAVIVAIIMVFSSSSVAMASDGNHASGKASSGEIAVGVFVEIVHSLLGNVLAKLDKSCPFCYSMHLPPEFAEPESNCRLVVNGEDITDGRYVKIDEENHQIYIPVIAIYEALGADIKSVGNLVFISYNGGMTMINMSLKNFGIPLMPGTYHGIRVVSADDAIVESDSFNYYFIRNMMGAEYEVDYESKVIYVNSVE